MLIGLLQTKLVFCCSLLCSWHCGLKVCRTYRLQQQPRDDIIKQIVQAVRHDSITRQGLAQSVQPCGRITALQQHANLTSTYRFIETHNRAHQIEHVAQDHVQVPLQSILGCCSRPVCNIVIQQSLLQQGLKILVVCCNDSVQVRCSLQNTDSTLIT